MKQVYIIFCLILGGVFIAECQPSSPDDIFCNMSYIVDYGNGSQKVRLVNGKYRYPDRHPLLCVYYEGEFVYGDFNSDELKDAAVIIYDSGGGSGYSINLAFLINDGTQLVHKSSYDLGYRPDIISLAEQQGKVVIDMRVYNESTWAEGKMDRVEVTYEYAGPSVWGPDMGLPIQSGIER